MTDTTQRTLLSITVFALAAALFLLLPTPAAADHTGWSVGAGFQIGGAHFSLVFGDHDGYRPGYYYRTTHRLHVRGHHCSDRCFHSGRRVYHHVSCPLVEAHLSRYRVHPGLLFDRFAPAPIWRGHRYRVDHPYRSHRRHDRYNRYDRDDRYRRHDRRDDRHHRWSDRRDHHGRNDRYDRDHWRDRRRHDRHDRYDRRRDDRRHDRRRGGRHHDHPGGGPHR